MLAWIEIMVYVAYNSAISEKNGTLVFVPKDFLLSIG